MPNLFASVSDGRAMQRKPLVMAFAILALALSYFSFADAFGSYTEASYPELAARVAPWNSYAISNDATGLLLTKGASATPAIRQEAIKALRLQALNAHAVTLLGVTQDMSSPANLASKAKALSLITLSQRLSRHDLMAQLWMIEYYANLGDLKQVLKHYDWALRTEDEARRALFPVLTQNLADPQIRAGLRPYVRSDTPWLTSFLIYAVAQSDNPSDVSRLIIETGPLPEAHVYRELERQLLDRLVSAGAFDEASNLYRKLKARSATRLIHAGFDQADVDQRDGGIGWQLVGNPDRGAEWATGDRGAIILRAYSTSDRSDFTARRLLYLRPGAYRLSATQSDVALGGGTARWILRCGTGPQSFIGWQSAAIPEGGMSRTNDLFTVNADCPHQFLELLVNSGEGMREAAMDVLQVRVEAIKNDTVAPRPVRTTSKAR